MSKHKDLVTFLKTLNLPDLKSASKNTLLSGDGVVGLSSLLVNNQVFDVVMIDPPYNENKSKGKYQDLWKGSGTHFQWAGEAHGSYLDFLYPRILLGREILSPDGVMMLFIGDSEHHYIRILMEQVFGEDNYIGTVIWDSSSNQQKSKSIDRNHEYVIIFAKDKSSFEKLGFYKINETSLESQLYKKAQELKNNNQDFKTNEKVYLAFFKEIQEKASVQKTSLGKFKYLTPSYDIFYPDNSGDPRSGSKKVLIHPVTKKPCPLPGGGKGWRYSDEYLERIAKSKNITILHDGRVLVHEVHDKKPDIQGLIFGKDETGVPNTVRCYSQKTDKKVMTTTGYTYKGDKKQGIDPTTGFETVKPKEFLSELLLNYPKKDAKVIDYFAGSGSTAVATHEANLKDGGSRSWTLIEINEETIKQVIVPKLSHFNIKDYKLIEIKHNSSKDIENFFKK